MLRIFASALLITALGATTFACSGTDGGGGVGTDDVTGGTGTPGDDTTGATDGGTTTPLDDTAGPVDGMDDPAACETDGAMECGPDGQVVTCTDGQWVDSGTCADGESCQAGECVEGACEPACDEATCGDDGCGGTCGDCESGWSCIDGSCDDTGCIGSCDGKVCGDDGCGNICGSCPGEELCDGEGQCVPEGGPIGEGACTNPEDLAVIEATDVPAFTQEAAMSCFGGGGDMGACVLSALTEGTDISEECGTCYVDTVLCIVDNCISVCMAEPEGDECTSCQEEFCNAAFAECSGLGDGPACEPHCEGQLCGDDGCGGVCGECDAGLVCDGGECVSDGGGGCGNYTPEGCCEGTTLYWCDQGETQMMECSEGEVPSCGWDEGKSSYDCGQTEEGPPEFPMSCQGDCTASCDGMACGDDGCGGSCGTCDGGTSCNGGQCVDEQPPGDGACTNDADAAITSAQDINEIAQSAAMSCFSEPDMGACVAESVSDQTGLSTECALCYGGTVGCIMANCMMDCMGGPDSPGCTICMEDSGCMADFEECSGGGGGQACEPSCGGMECGDDGCGGTCGMCAGGATCDGGQCVEEQPPGDDACINETDAAILDAQDIAAAAQQAAMACLSSPDIGACTVEGLMDETGLSAGCAGCYGGQVVCVFENCIAQCAVAPDSSECQTCQADNCLQAFEECSGIGGGGQTCEPSCNGAQCGDDGCGGTCGTCDAGATCDAGQCVDEPPAGGACANAADEAIMDAQDVAEVAQGAAMSCFSANDMPACIADAVTDGTGLSGDCALCYGGLVGCIMDNCMMDCMMDPASAGCTSCQESSGCQEEFEACGFGG